MVKMRKITINLEEAKRTAVLVYPLERGSGTERKKARIQSVLALSEGRINVSALTYLSF